MKSGGPSDELLVALGSKDKQWSVLDDVTVRNLPNGLVSFELVEIFDRFVWGGRGAGGHSFSASGRS